MSCPDQNLADFHHYRHYEGLRLLPTVCDSKLIQQTLISDIDNVKDSFHIINPELTKDLFRQLAFMTWHGKEDNDGYKGPENVIDHLWEFTNGACRKTNKMKTDNH